MSHEIVGQQSGCQRQKELLSVRATTQGARSYAPLILQRNSDPGAQGRALIELLDEFSGRVVKPYT
jgi:hypothetical protein